MFENSKILTLDFETHDPYLDIMGAGWATDTLEPLCVGLKRNNDVTEVRHLGRYGGFILDADVFVAHNAQYDLGILASQSKSLLHSDILFVDTMILAKLYDNTLGNYSLDFLAKKYLKKEKATGTLGDIVLRHKLINCKDPTTKLSLTKAKNYADEHMKQLYELEPETVKEYCKIDVDLTKELFDFFTARFDNIEYYIRLYSDFLKCCIESRLNGIHVNTEKLFDIKQKLDEERQKALVTLKELSGNPDFNPMSTENVAQLLLKHGYDVPKTSKGNHSIKGEWLDAQHNELCHLVYRYRICKKLANDFCDNILQMMSLLPEGHKGKIYPTINILGGEGTGRMSGKQPNMQNIPNAKKHKEIGALIRGAYEASPGKLFASLDYGAQEPRWLLHFASLIGAKGSDELVKAYNENPNLDLHVKVGHITGQITDKMSPEEQKKGRNNAKEIALAVSYGMGRIKLCKKLGLSEKEGIALLNDFHAKLPYLKAIDKAAKVQYRKNKYIKTYLGRKLRLESSETEFKALNQLIQGSAADQITLAMVELWRRGFKILFPVHDEINLEVSSVEEALEAKKIMEEVVKLRVPVVAELKLGKSWGDGKDVSIEDLSTSKSIN